MSKDETTTVVLTKDNRVLIEQPDGSFRPTRSRTDWDRVRQMPEEEIESAATGDPDAPPLDAEFWRTARVVLPRRIRKRHTGLRIDEDVLEWFRAQGKGYMTRMNAVLRSYMEAHKGQD